MQSSQWETSPDGCLILAKRVLVPSTQFAAGHHPCAAGPVPKSCCHLDSHPIRSLCTGMGRMAALAAVSDFGLAPVSSAAGSGSIPSLILLRVSRGAEHRPAATHRDIPTWKGLSSLGHPQKPPLDPSSGSASLSPL